MLPRNAIVGFALLACGSAVAVKADTIIIGTPSQIAAAQLGNTLGTSIGQAMKAGVQLSASKAAASEEIAEARRVFFQNYPNGPAIAEARERFASLLFQKDIFYFSLFLSEGMTPSTEARAELLNKITGGEIDGGIPSAAKSSFGAWVDVVRTSMGARRRGELIFPTESATLKAIGEHMPEYNAYQKRRDEIELARKLAPPPSRR